MLIMGSCLSRSRKYEQNTFPRNDEQVSPKQLEKVTMSILLVFDKDDKQCSAFLEAAKVTKYKCHAAKSIDSVSKSFLEYRSNVIIVDTRQTTQVDAVCKTFAYLKNRESAIFVAVREKMPSNAQKKTDMAQLLKVGFTRQFPENLSVLECISELQCIENGELQNRFQFLMSRAFAMACDLSRDSIEITNTNNEIQYVNSSYQQIFGFKRNEVIGKDFLKMMKCLKKTDEQSIRVQMKQGKVWKGQLSLCNKMGDKVMLESCIIPVMGQSDQVLNYIVLRNSRNEDTISIQSAAIDSSKPYKSRESITTRVPLKIEAPITRVIDMIGKIQETCSTEVAQSLDQVLETLRSTELYVPLQPTKIDDAMSNELLVGLMAPIARRNSSGVPGAMRKAPRVSIFSKYNDLEITATPAKVEKLLADDHKWDFNILDLEKISAKKPLLYLGMKIFTRFKVIDFMKVDERTLFLWFSAMEQNYHSQMAYHNSTHAADVMHASAYFLNMDKIKNLLEMNEKVAVLIGAVVHDLDHPGKTSAYLINSQTYLAQLYNDLCVLENHHVSLAFRLTQQDDNINIFKNLTLDEYQEIRQQIIDIVLATEISKHLEHLSRFVHTINEGESSGISKALINKLSLVPIGGLDHKTIIKRMLIKCCDLSNCAKPTDVCIIWANRISDEYFQQTDDEKKNLLPVVMPLFDRKTCNLADVQKSFINIFIKDMFDAWNTYNSIPDLLEHIRLNFVYWNTHEKLYAKEGKTGQKKKTVTPSSNEKKEKTSGHEKKPPTSSNQKKVSPGSRKQ